MSERHSVHWLGARRLLAAWWGLSVASSSFAQALCQSDHRLQLNTLHERFISADCAACWQAEGSAIDDTSTLSIDWIAPGQKGDEAPLSAAELIDAEDRLQQLGQGPVQDQLETRTRLGKPLGADLDLSFGVAIGGYRGLSVELKLEPGVSPPEQLMLWVLMLERLPAGTEGSKQVRQLVRNALQQTWRAQDFAVRDSRSVVTELRPMRMPDGMQAERMMALAWVQSPQGQILKAALADCPPKPK